MTRAQEDEFFADDALPTHHLDDDLDGRQRGVCPHSGGSRNSLGGCPRGCGGAREHYSNDGHRGCFDPTSFLWGSRSQNRTSTNRETGQRWQA